jgi:hypothetical protein
VTADMTRAQKDLLDPFADQMHSLEWTIHLWVRQATDDELADMLAAARAVSTTNCWFMTYEVAPLVEREALREQTMRTLRAESLERARLEAVAGS